MKNKTKVEIKKDKLPYQDSFEFYKKYTENGELPSMLMESRSKHLAYGKQSIVIPNPAIIVTGKNEYFKLEAMTETGEAIIDCFSKSDFPFVNDLKINSHTIEGHVKKADIKNLDEMARLKSPNTSHVIRTILNKFDVNDEHAGLSGAFAYDFARQFYEIGNRFKNHEGNDFHLFMGSTIAYFDDIKEQAQLKRFFFKGKNEGLEEKISNKVFVPQPFKTYEDMSIDELFNKIVNAKEEVQNGRFMQVVLSRTQGMSLQKPPIDSYNGLREIKAPYSLYICFGNEEYAYAASPEILQKSEDGSLHVRPIAGTIVRTGNSLKDFKEMLFLQTDPKERKEHTILVDLGRNEMYKTCVYNTVTEKDLYVMEDNGHLTHLVSGINGKLKPDIDSLHAFQVIHPAGTVTGGPKHEAMKYIEQNENSRRGYYAGGVGNFNHIGGCNIGLFIRGAYVNDGMSYIRSGMGIVFDSDPAKEVEEHLQKIANASNALKVQK